MAAKRRTDPTVHATTRAFLDARDGALGLPESAAALRAARELDNPNCSRLPDLMTELRQTLAVVRDLSQPVATDELDELRGRRGRRSA